mgnify:CR=1 FL=1
MAAQLLEPFSAYNNARGLLKILGVNRPKYGEPGEYKNLKDGKHFIPGNKFYEAGFHYIYNGHKVSDVEYGLLKGKDGAKAIKDSPIGQGAIKFGKGYAKYLRSQQFPLNRALKAGNTMRKALTIQTLGRMTATSDPHDDPTRTVHQAHQETLKIINNLRSNSTKE